MSDTGGTGPGGIELPIRVPAEDAVVTLEKLAARLLELEEAMRKTQEAGGRMGDNLAKGFAQGLGQKVFEEGLKLLKQIPGEIERSIMASAEWADKMVKLGQSTGFAVEKLQEMELGAKQAGVGIEGLARQSAMLTAKLSTSPKAFADLGLSITGMAKASNEVRFDKVMTQLKGMGSEQERLQHAIELFGTRIGPQMAKLSAAWGEAAQRSHELGLVWKNEDMAAASEFTDAMEELESTTGGFWRALGGFVTTDKQVRDGITQTSTVIGKMTTFILGLRDAWQQVDPATRRVIDTVVLLTGATVGLVAIFAATKIAAVAFGAQIVAMGAQFGVTGIAVTGLGSALKIVGLSALGAAKQFAMLTLAALPWIAAIAAIIAAIYLGAKAGEYLYSKFAWFKDLVDWIANATRKLAEFLGLLPDEAERKKIEQGVKFGVGVDPAKMKVYEQWVKDRQSLIDQQKKEAEADKLLTGGEQLKKELAVQQQIDAVLAKRGGAIAAANQQYSATMRMAQLDLDIAKAKLIVDEKDDAKRAQKYADLDKVFKLNKDLAALQRDEAIRQERVATQTQEIDNAKQLADMQRGIARIQEERIGTLAQIAGAYRDTAEAANADYAATVAKLNLQKQGLGLEDEAAAKIDAQITQATKVRDLKLEEAEATRQKALREEQYTRELARGLVHAKDEKIVVAEIVAALANPKAIITDADLAKLDQAWQLARRLGEPFEALRKSADEAFERIADQKAIAAVDELERKIREGIRLTPADLQGLVDMRESIGASTVGAGKLDEAIQKVAANMRQLSREEFIRQKAADIAQQQVQLENERFAKTKEGLGMLQYELYLRLRNAGIEEEEAYRIAHATIAQMRMNEALSDAERVLNIISGLFGDIGVGADSAAGKALNLASALLQAAKAGQQAKELWKTDKIGALAAGANVLGNIWKSNAQQRSGAMGAASGAAQGAAFGSAFGPIGAGVGAVVGGLVGFFAGSKWRKVCKDAGRVLGEGLSDETIKKIQADSEKLKISVKKAALLNISTAMEDTGKAASSYATQIGDLMTAIADKSVPAKEGIEELGKMFGAVADEAMKAGRVGDRAMVGIIKQARALKIESPEIKAFVGEQLDRALEGVHKFVAAINVLDKEWLKWLRDTRGKVLGEEGLAKAEETIKSLGQTSGIVFGAMFDALVSERGIVGAVDALGDDFKTLKERLTETLGAEATSKIVAPFAAAFATINDEHLRPLFEGIDGLSQAMQGLANAGYLSTEQFAAMQTGISQMFDTAIAGGADTKTALLAVSPAIQAAITAAEQFGVPLTADMARLKALAEQNGITFKTDPQQAMLDVLVAIADVLGAKLPESVTRMRDAMVNGTDAASQAFGRLQQQAAQGLDVEMRVHERGGYTGQGGGEPELQTGGIVNAPLSGMRAILHGPEIVAPLDRFERMLKTIAPGGSTTNVTVNVAEDPYATNETRRQARQFTLDAAADAIARNAPL